MATEKTVMTPGTLGVGHVWNPAAQRFEVQGVIPAVTASILPVYGAGNTAARANALGTVADGLLLSDGSVLATGRVRKAAHGYTVGKSYYLSQATAGAVVTPAPTTGLVQKLFYAVDADNIEVCVGAADVADKTVGWLANVADGIDAKASTPGIVPASYGGVFDAVALAGAVGYDMINPLPDISAWTLNGATVAADGTSGAYNPFYAVTDDSTGANESPETTAYSGSIRLNRAYRLMFQIKLDGSSETSSIGVHSNGPTDRVLATINHTAKTAAFQTSSAATISASNLTYSYDAASTVLTLAFDFVRTAAPAALAIKPYVFASSSAAGTRRIAAPVIYEPVLRQVMSAIVLRRNTAYTQPAGWAACPMDTVSVARGLKLAASGGGVVVQPGGDGLYEVKALGGFILGSLALARFTAIAVNGTRVAASGNVSTRNIEECTAIVPLAAGDVVTCQLHNGDVVGRALELSEMAPMLSLREI
ncbi:hypothetical protein VSS37_03800 [Candidatus Thiothrix sp. Deng01]|uniref:Uncharacterized protein n=1 Tax=Candidatus Thiothrix phosphatis TaxID=3112415 RepID=A0ABU6CTD5_9GAMM|nr:hypothetical protein [Candidatus Thiothrix sp. Deng01]MEB4590095.1 hypothetical protein [Candidatus Thiothrix sp. Deng01]